MKRLFQYAILYRPTDAERKTGRDTEIVIEPTGFFLAASEEEVCMIAARRLPDDMMDKADRLEVAVRPF